MLWRWANAFAVPVDMCRLILLPLRGQNYQMCQRRLRADDDYIAEMTLLDTNLLPSVSCQQPWGHLSRALTQRCSKRTWWVKSPLPLVVALRCRDTLWRIMASFRPQA